MGKGIDNAKYREMKVRDDVFVPDCEVEYPESNSEEHIAGVRYDGREVILDGTYPYLDDSFHYKFHHFLNWFLRRIYVAPVNRLRYGLKIKGKENIRRYADLFKDGAMTVCNHVYRWDLVSVVDAVGARDVWFPIFGDHLRGKDYWFMRFAGGIPIPESRSGMRPFNEAFDELHRRKQWIHVFPEAASWRFYTPVRSFKTGAFTMAYKYALPVIPCVITYRPRTGIYKLFEKPDVPLLTLHIGTPVIPDISVPRKKEVERILKESHRQMVSMAGIINNPWPAEMQ